MKHMTEADKEKRRAYQRAWIAKRKQRLEAATATGAFKCDKCERSFPTQHGLELHVLRTHSSKAHRWNKSVVNANRQRNGTTESGVLFCPKCGCNIKAVGVAMANF